MSNYDMDKEQLLERLNRVRTAVSELLPDSVFLTQLEELRSELYDDFCTVVVLGEFKRGKSTFVNALLGEELLPVDVTPTTATINAIHYGEQSGLAVYKQDGSVEREELSAEALRKYSVDGAANPEEVRYLKITMPAPLLQPNVVLVDTPGVDDLNRQRAEVTYQFIPKADVCIFLLDAVSPVKRSEKDFLTDTLLSEGLDRMIFIANFYDQVDQEEAEGHLENIKRRLAGVLGGQKPKVLPFSATDALDARVTKDFDKLQQSGFTAVLEAVEGLIQHGSRGETKLTRFRSRLKALNGSIGRELEGRLAQLNESSAELALKLEGVEGLIRRHGAIRVQMEDYARDRETEMLAIVRKSLRHFEEQLKEDMQFTVQQYMGPQLKEFVETQIPMQVKRRFKQWIEQHTPSILKLLQMLEQELATALATEFNTSLRSLEVKQRSDEIDSPEGNVSITAADLSNTPIMAGLLAGGAGMLAMLLGGPLLLPLVGMAGYPFIQKHMMQDQLKKAKEKLLPELDAVLDQVMEEFGRSVEQWLLQNAASIRKAADSRYMEIVRMHRMRIDQDIAGVMRAQEEKEHEQQRLIQAREDLITWGYSL
ncbi:dynamin family protein [Paenibacillus sp. GD4]|uniref:dynamin family protein n=1 Tax=Paenibacillus sp. GD4 TaxID=3068890 RepID=UPI0027965B88|nr:dynamin family protein [Paenibacillus sp. GD4]MDQ1909060.1 dynamin family protein [Paenibacillus sp. GD4]